MGSETQQKYDVVVLGAGPGGYAAAFKAADLGLNVALVDVQENPGGVCLYRGCIPSKALLHVAKLIHEAKNSENWGVSFGKPVIDLDKLRAYKDSVVQKLTGGLGQLTKQRKLTYIQGEGFFLDAHNLKVGQIHGGVINISFDNAIVATGSRPTTLPNWPLESPYLLNSTGALALESIPQSLLVVGGGYIGVELGSVYATLGSDVTVVEMTSNYLPGADKDLILPLAKQLKELFKESLFETKVVAAQEVDNGLKVTLENKDGKRDVVYNKVLVSIGRRPNSSGLGLDNTGVKINDRGFIETNEMCQTAEPTIYAIGDVAGDPMLAHKASHEGIVAAEVIAGHKVAFEPRAIPAVVFTDPEIAWCGLTENQAKEQNREVKIVRFPWPASGRALSMDRTDGVTKMILDPQTEQVLGVGITGAGAGEMIAEGVLAIEMGATAKDIALSIHAHPTLSETVMESAELFYGSSTHLYRPSKK